LTESFENDIKHCITVLQNGGLILYPTDTIWGIGCDATNDNAIEKVYSLKKRSDKKLLIILVEDEKEIFNYVTNPGTKIFDYLSSTQKPTTVIYEGAKDLSQKTISPDGTIAIRIVKDAFCKELIREFKKPIVSTSANISGEQFSGSFSDINQAIKNGVDYIVQHRQNDISTSQPSSIIRLNAEDEIEIIR